jgi:hypothetical protein
MWSFAAGDPYLLYAQTLKVHLDSRVNPVPTDAMPEPGGIKIGAKLSSQAAGIIRLNSAVTPFMSS